MDREDPDLIQAMRVVLRMLLPYRIRRPIADGVYLVIAHGLNVLHKVRYFRVKLFAIGSNKDIPARIFQALVSGFRLRVGKLYGEMWHRASEYRHLLAGDGRLFSIGHQVQRNTLKLFLSLPDIKYRRVFNRTGKVMVPDALKYTGKGILFAIGSLGAGGSERQLVLTMTNLAKRIDVPLMLFCSCLKSEIERFYLHHLETAGVPVRELDRVAPDTQPPELSAILLKVRYLPSTIHDEVTHYIRTIYTARPAIVHLWLDEVNVAGGIAAAACGVPRVILSLRSLPPCNFPLHKPYMREGYRWLARQPGVVLVNNSKAGGRAYEKWLGLPPGSIRVVHNGFDFNTHALKDYRVKCGNYREHHHIPGNAILIGTVIRFTEEKRPLLWLEIAAEIRRRLPGTRFLIVGNGPLDKAMKDRAEQGDLKGAVSFPGYAQDIYSYIAMMDILLLTSRAEGLPNVLVEAQALGVPVVTTRAGGAPETLDHGITGWVLDSDDVQHAAEIITGLMKDAAWQCKAGIAAPVYVRERFGLERMMDENLGLYDNMFARVR